MARKQLLKNLTHLGLMQITNYLVPLIAIPILLERVGLTKYGIIALAVSVSNLFVTVTDYGYELTGTREVSKYRDDRDRLQSIISEILHVRIFLLPIGFLILGLLTWMIPTWREESLVFLSTFLIVVAQALFPVWYFQGIEKMGFLAAINLLARLLYLGGILVFIQSEADYIYVNIINGIAWMIPALSGMVLVIHRVGWPKRTPPIDTVWKGLHANFPIFLSKVTTAVHRNCGMIIGSFFMVGDKLGLYAIIDKILAVISLAVAIIFRALFPRVSEITAQGYGRVKAFFVRFLKLVAVPTLLGSAILVALGPTAIDLLASSEVQFSTRGYFWLIALFPPLLIVNMPLTLTLIAFNHRRQFFIYNFLGMLTMVVAGLLGAHFLEITGLITATLLAEVVTLIAGYIMLKKSSSGEAVL